MAKKKKGSADQDKGTGSSNNSTISDIERLFFHSETDDHLSVSNSDGLRLVCCFVSHGYVTSKSSDVTRDQVIGSMFERS